MPLYSFSWKFCLLYNFKTVVGIFMKLHTSISIRRKDAKNLMSTYIVYIKDGTIKDLVSSQAFNIGIQSNIWTVFHATNTWLQARVLMLWYYTTVISLPCFKDLVSSQGFNVGIQSNIWTVFHATKTWLQARVLMWYCTTVISLPCFKDLVSSQGFNVGIQSNIWTVFLYQRHSFKPGLWC